MAFEGILSQPDAKPARWRRVTLTVSLGLHLGALAVGIIYSIWRVDEMPMPAIQVMLADAPPPPPPPPPPAKAKKSPTAAKPRPKPAAPGELVQPKLDKDDTKQVEKPAEQEGRGGGVEGGIEGGVEGGVLGGVVGSPPHAAPPPPPPKPVAPKVISATKGHHQLAINPNAPPYCCVKIPRSMEQAGASISARLRVCVTADGQVNHVQVVDGAGGGIDAQIPNFVRRWRYTPYLDQGVPVPFCYVFRYEMNVR